MDWPFVRERRASEGGRGCLARPKVCPTDIVRQRLAQLMIDTSVNQFCKIGPLILVLSCVCFPKILRLFFCDCVIAFLTCCRNCKLCKVSYTRVSYNSIDLFVRSCSRVAVATSQNESYPSFGVNPRPAALQ